jgi:hypothetical protein
MKVVVGGVLSLPPFSSGTAWDRLHYVLGLRDLGHEVLFVEEVQPDWCFDLRGRRCDYAHSANRAAFQAVMSDFGLQACSCQLYDGGRATAGLSLSRLRPRLAGADVLINISGHVKSDVVLDAVGRRAYLDQDPVYTQLWRAEYGHDLNLDAHDTFLTVGLNIGTPHSDMPTCGLTWHHTLPPVVMNGRPALLDGAGGRFSTIASWTSFGDICYRGEWYLSKEAEFKRFAELPARVEQEFEVALRRHDPVDEGVRLLHANGWIVTESSRFTDLAVYREHIVRSRAEIGIAKNAYVKGRSGWFSDRTADYLAHGRPALVQATGFERYLPTGQGLLAFTSMEEAVEGVQRINDDYRAHCKAAREIAESYLDARKVLPRLLEDCAG